MVRALLAALAVTILMPALALWIWCFTATARVRLIVVPVIISSVVNLAVSTFANVAAIPNQKRTITLLTADELKFDNPRTPSGMTLRTAWKRAAAP